ncbi:hypothetical protein AD929_12850 [Gluconobacter potus]|uniref:Cysteine--tRNA ligase n=1 Tax=Gluconobacter potus TaxID=2724927 RepID=A0A149QS21_9PROT|nr:cysteine--tRNA ligase [Gluconobacter potus]KXV00103.1 hypothetical protein AD929_12850 [Gluconobacter potus]
MMKLYNSLTRRVEPFVPLEARRIGMYVCGPTVYDLPHLGNARSAVVFDTLRRILMHAFPHVDFVRNITDVDDKIISRATELGEDIATLTARTHASYLEDMGALGVLAPTTEPRATDHIAHMQDMIARLVARGHAYVSQGHVLFEVATNPSPGVLRDTSGLQVGASQRVDGMDYKRSPADFVLWKPAAKGEPGWESPWGYGRPGWHIECSAMAAEYLGPVFDIHGGGSDLEFPHHENEIAQSTCAHGTKQMARYFVHNGMLTVDGVKMSKSRGNFLTVRDVLRRYPGQGDAVRLTLLSALYRHELDFTWGRLEENIALMSSIRSVAARSSSPGTPDAGLVEALQANLNTPLAISRLHYLVKNGLSDALLASARLLGLSLQAPAVPQAAPQDGPEAGGQPDDEEIIRLVSLRQQAREARDFARADSIRDELAALGVSIKDSPQGPVWKRMGGVNAA